MEEKKDMKGNEVKELKIEEKERLMTILTTFQRETKLQKKKTHKKNPKRLRWR